ncbi:LysR substrate-binding domain-containing protein [Nocardia sp. CA-120079]|uniref:LysR substrate-binding domain-containing protein n=1 Tax=Nocardia sp. CA-120079 TaxID=3239974 RepID=UPI003D95669E
MEAHTRKLRYFVVLAGELHFSRAAARLHMSQQALSKHINELEDEVGAALFDRSKRQIRLTVAGEVFLTAVQRSLAVLDEGALQASRAALGEIGTLKVGATVGAALELTEHILAAFTEVAPDVQVELQEYSFGDRSAGLASGDTDIAFVRRPIVTPDLDYFTLFVEPLAVAVHRDHRLADRYTVGVRDLADEPIVVGRSTDADAERFWTLGAYRDSSAPVVYASSTTEELLFVATGRCCMVTATASVRWQPHPYVRYLAITDAPGSELAVAWPSGSDNPLVKKFISAARTALERQAELIRQIEQPSGF